MKVVNMTYHTTQEEGNSLSVSVPDDAEVRVLDARTIGGTDTRFQFVIVTEQAARSRSDGAH